MQVVRETGQWLEDQMAKNHNFHTEEWIQRAYSQAIYDFANKHIESLEGEIMPYHYEDIEVVWSELGNSVDLIRYKGKDIAKVILHPPFYGIPNVEFIYLL